MTHTYPEEKISWVSIQHSYSFDQWPTKVLTGISGGPSMISMKPRKVRLDSIVVELKKKITGMLTVSVLWK